MTIYRSLMTRKKRIFEVLLSDGQIPGENIRGRIRLLESIKRISACSFFQRRNARSTTSDTGFPTKDARLLKY